MIRDIPAVSPDDACKSIINIIEALPGNQQNELEKLSLAYTSYVRALIGAIFEYIGASTSIVRKSLNGVTTYKLPISEAALPTKTNWNIHEPSRK